MAAIAPPTATRQCTATSNQSGQQCKRYAIKGATVCWKHGGNMPGVQRKALVRAELEDWGLTEQVVDPGETLLRLVSQSARRAAFYSDLLQQAYQLAEEDHQRDIEDLVGLGSPFRMPAGLAALIGKKYRVTENYGRMAVGEAITGLTQLEMLERKLCADFAEKAIRAGLAERQVRLAEQTGTAIIEAIKIALDRAGIIGPARLDAQDAAAEYLLNLSAS